MKSLSFSLLDKAVSEFVIHRDFLRKNTLGSLEF